MIFERVRFVYARFDLHIWADRSCVDVYVLAVFWWVGEVCRVSVLRAVNDLRFKGGCYVICDDRDVWVSVGTLVLQFL